MINGYTVLGIVTGLIAFAIMQFVPVWRAARARREFLRPRYVEIPAEREPVTVLLPTEADSLLEEDPEIPWHEVGMDDGSVGFMNPLTGEIVVPAGQD